MGFDHTSYLMQSPPATQFELLAAEREVTPLQHKLQSVREVSGELQQLKVFKGKVCTVVCICNTHVCKIERIPYGSYFVGLCFAKFALKPLVKSFQQTFETSPVYHKALSHECPEVSCASR